MRRTFRLITIAVTSLLMLSGGALFPGHTRASPAQVTGVTKNSIKIGTSLPLSGVAAAYGAIAYGTQAYFNYVNAKGGVYKRKLHLTILDDGYDPARTLTNVQNLVSNQGVFALMDVLGTANNLAARPYITSHKIPLVYPATGSSLMTHPLNKYTFAIQVNYTVEGKILTDYAVKTLHAKKIGVFYQNDEFGKEGLAAIQNQAAKDGASVADAEPYELTQTDLSPQALKLKGAGVDAMIIFATPRAYITFVVTASKIGLSVPLLSSTVALAYVVIKALGPLAEGLYFDAYTGLPLANNAKANFFRTVMNKYADLTKAPIDTFAAVGFGAGQVLVEALKRAGKSPTREGLIKALEAFKKWKGSIYGPLTWTAKTHAGLKGAYLVRVHNGAFKTLTKYKYPK
jgi:branched-chain amino acid transport system substrate-binding protein